MTAQKHKNKITQEQDNTKYENKAQDAALRRLFFFILTGLSFLVVLILWQYSLRISLPKVDEPSEDDGTVEMKQRIQDTYSEIQKVFSNLSNLKKSLPENTDAASSSAQESQEQNPLQENTNNTQQEKSIKDALKNLKENNQATMPEPEEPQLEVLEQFKESLIEEHQRQLQ